MGADFSGYATKAGLKCSDGRTIMPHAFKAQDGMKVPLVWQHGHNQPANVLGHALLENRDDGVYTYGYFNETDQGKSAKMLVQHGDITALSIYANKLVEKSKQVLHGAIREVSLVLSGANPGALIDNVTLQHADGSTDELDDEVIIYTGLTLEHEDKPDDETKIETPLETKTETTVEKTEKIVEEAVVEHADGLTVQQVYDSMNETQKNVVHYMVGAALEASGSAEHSHTNEDELNHQEGTKMTRNVFEKTSETKKKHELSHDDIKGIMSSATKSGSLKHAVQEYALEHGIENIDVLFPEVTAISSVPEFNSRRMEWVAGVINGTRHSPFARIKTLSADLTFEQARAKGYVKATMKKEEFFGVAKRITTPTTIYKKQKLDRDDIIDITDFDVIAWLKSEMRLMLDEELARAVLLGDGRAVDDDDKINETNIRPIAKEDELYATTVNVNIDDANSNPSEIIDAVLSSRRFYKGTGQPTFYTTEIYLTQLLLAKDTLGRRLYPTIQSLAAEMRVSDIIPCEAMEDDPTLIGIIVNLSDYTLGADKGGDVSMFDFFDIDFNQYKYLIETRVSGCLTKIKAALVIRKVAANLVVVVPAEPSFVAATGALTIVNQTGVVYKHGATTINAAGSPYTVPAGTTWVVDALPASGYYFPTSQNDQWSFTADPA